MKQRMVNDSVFSSIFVLIVWRIWTKDNENATNSGNKLFKTFPNSSKLGQFLCAHKLSNIFPNIILCPPFQDTMILIVHIFASKVLFPCSTKCCLLASLPAFGLEIGEQRPNLLEIFLGYNILFFEEGDSQCSKVNQFVENLLK